MKRLIGILLGLVAALPGASAAQHVSLPAPVPIAYAEFAWDWYCPPCEGGICDLGCYGPFPTSRIVTLSTLTAGPSDADPTWSPLATHIAYVSGTDIVVMDATGTAPVNVTNSSAAEWTPAWSPDGRRIAFASDRDGQAELYLMNPDGSNVVRLTTNVGFTSRPAWSPNSSRIAFNCEIEAGNADVCALNVDGSGLLRLTIDAARDSDPAWSPDGETIAFATDRYGAGDLQLALMNTDGTNVSRIDLGAMGVGLNPARLAWSPDGRLIAFDSTASDEPTTYGVRPDGSSLAVLAHSAYAAAWMPVSPFATFSIDCHDLSCTFNGSSSIGAIVDYVWDFGDQIVATGDVVSHTFASAGVHTIELAVTDTSGAMATESRTIYLNFPPLVTFTVACDGVLTCLFDASASRDPDGLIQRVLWSFGDGTGDDCGGSCTTRLHTYAAGGSYTATFRAIDNSNGTATATRTFTVPTPYMHVGDLDGRSTTSPGKWSATVTIDIHNANHAPIANALVTGVWNNGNTVSCTTNTSGRCVVSRLNLRPQESARVTVTDVTHAVFLYEPSSNHDPDGDSDGTSITVSR